MPLRWAGRRLVEVGEVGGGLDVGKRGVAADVIALKADPRQDTGALRKVGFVINDTRVWKRDGKAVGMI